MNNIVSNIKVGKEVKYRRPLNKEQIDALHTLYWFRFCTGKQLATVLHKANPKAIQNKLHILEEQELISKRYDKSYKLAGRPAEYYLTPKGARALEKARPSTTNQLATKSLYKNRTVSDMFLIHCINVTDACLQLASIYNDKLQCYSKSYMVQHSHYPEWTPDAFLQLDTSQKKQDYFVDIWDDTKPFFVAVRKTRNYVNFKDNDEWVDDAPFPVILAICNDEASQKKLNRQMKRILADTWDDELTFATTTKQQLYAATKPTEKLWLKIEADDTPQKTTLRLLCSTS